MPIKCTVLVTTRSPVSKLYWRQWVSQVGLYKSRASWLSANRNNQGIGRLCLRWRRMIRQRLRPPRWWHLYSSCHDQQQRCISEIWVNVLCQRRVSCNCWFKVVYRQRAVLISIATLMMISNKHLMCGVYRDHAHQLQITWGFWMIRCRLTGNECDATLTPLPKTNRNQTWMKKTRENLLSGHRI